MGPAAANIRMGSLPRPDSVCKSPFRGPEQAGSSPEEVETSWVVCVISTEESGGEVSAPSRHAQFEPVWAHCLESTW